MHGLLLADDDDDVDADAPFLVRSLRTLLGTTPATDDAKDAKLGAFVRPLEEGVAVTGVGAAVLARCQMRALAATALVLAVPPAPVGGAAPLGAFERRLAAVVAGVKGAVGLVGEREGEGNGGEVLRAAAKALRREGQGRWAEGGGMLYM